MTSLDEWLKDWADWSADYIKATCLPDQATLAEPDSPPWRDAKTSSNEEGHDNGNVV